MNRVKFLIATVLASIGLFVGGAMPVFAQATPGSNALGCGAAGELKNGLAPNGACTTGTDPEARVQNVIKLAIRIFQIIVGIIAIFYVITGGLKYITSGGDSGSIGTAKNTILYAAIGLIVVALAEVVVQFVLTQANKTGGTI